MVLTHRSGLGGIEMSDRPIYTFVGATIPDIDPAHDVVHNHHITIKFRPSDADHSATPYGDSCWWVATGRVITDDVDAVIVRFVGGPITNDTSQAEFLTSQSRFVMEYHRPNQLTLSKRRLQMERLWISERQDTASLTAHTIEKEMKI